MEVGEVADDRRHGHFIISLDRVLNILPGEAFFLGKPSITQYSSKIFSLNIKYTVAPLEEDK
jgi:hypothetical protein